MSLPEIDFDGLEKVYAGTAEAPDEQFSMEFYDCGTTACMLGWFCRKYPDDILTLESDDPKKLRLTAGFLGAAEFHRFGLSTEESSYLFYNRMANKVDPLSRLREFIDTKGASGPEAERKLAVHS